MPLRFTVCGPAFSLIVIGTSGAKVGALFTKLTVTVKVLVTASTPPLAVPPLSFTITLINALPLALATGVKESVPDAFGLV